jgi:hypothetical protein
MRRRLDALAEVHDLGALFPFLRPAGAEVLAFADTVATYAAAYPGPWSTVCDDVGDPAVAERALVVGAVRAAVGERRLPPRAVLEEVEAADEALDSPEKALLFVLSPSNVWSIRDVVDASEAADGAADFGAWVGAIDAVADERVGDEHAERVRLLAGYVARRLPLEGLPRTSSLLSSACDALERDSDLANELALYLLTNYVVRFGTELNSAPVSD